MHSEAATIGTDSKRISSTTLAEVRDALREYCAVVERSGLSLSSQATYIDMANNFVRWMSGDFNPGARNGPRLVRKDPRP
jgi:hypothetical protein